MTLSKFTIAPQGPFSLKEAATFGFGQRAGADWDGAMRLAFCVDGYSAQPHFPASPPTNSSACTA
jgi:DNA-3-methyladenine glycosylase II